MKKIYLVEDNGFKHVKVFTNLDEAQKGQTSDSRIKVTSIEGLNNEIEQLNVLCQNIRRAFLYELACAFNNFLDIDNVAISFVKFDGKEVILDVEIGFKRFRLSNVFWIDEGETQSPNSLIISPMYLITHDKYTDNGECRLIDILIGKIWEYESKLLDEIFIKLDNVCFEKIKAYHHALDLAKFIVSTEE